MRAVATMLSCSFAGILAAACAPPAPPEALSETRWATLSGEPPLVIAHRGASGERPEHTLEAYRLAIAQGAEVIEPDLVITSDGVLVARHDRYLSTTTNIADHPEFADRRRVEGERNDWWVEDFTLEELRRLRARQPFPGRSQDYDDQYLIPTFEEVLDLAAEAGVRTEPEMKAPGRFVEAGLDPLPVLVDILRARGLDGADATTSIQCFEPDFLVRLDAEIDTPLLMLVFETGQGPSVTLDAMADFADGVGPQKTLAVDETGADTGYIARAHALGLAVHPWTFRDDAPAPDGVSIEEELRRFYALGADGVFTDFPATAVRVRAAMAEEG